MLSGRIYLSIRAGRWVVGLLALDQRPTTVDLIGAALVVSGVIVQERDELAPAEPPG